MFDDLRAIRKREAELSCAYGIEHTTWEKDWPFYYKLKANLYFYRSKFKNRTEIFETLKFIIAAAACIVVSAILMSIFKRLWIIVVGTLASLAIISLIYYIYFYIYVQNKIRDYEWFISPFYDKWDRDQLHTYFECRNYDENKIPPKPVTAMESDSYFDYDIDLGDFPEENDEKSKEPEIKVEKAEIKPAETNEPVNESETVEEEEEKQNEEEPVAEEPEAEKAEDTESPENTEEVDEETHESGINLHLFKHRINPGSDYGDDYSSVVPQQEIVYDDSDGTEDDLEYVFTAVREDQTADVETPSPDKNLAMKENGNLFPDDYMPTTEEILAVLSELRIS